jgi:cytochrome c5
MKKYWMHISLGIMLLAAIPLASQTSKDDATQPSSGQKQPKKGATTEIDGDQVFQQNCARCHTVPESFSPRISGTVIRHMRVRAGLSAQDEKALLRFLNP